MPTENTANARPVALLMPNFEAGGAERVMIRLAQGLAQAGHTVHLVVLSDHGPYRSMLSPQVPGIQVHSLKAKRAWQAVPAMVRYLLAHQPTAVLSALFHCNFLAVASRAIVCRLTNHAPRVVISEHNTLDLVHTSVSPLRWQLFKLALRWAYPRADSVVCVSDGIAQGLGSALPRLKPQLCVIGNPVVTDDMLRQSHAPLNHPWAQAGQPPLVLAVGRLIPAKGFDVLLTAFQQVIKKLPARLMILGEGPERENLQSQIAALGLTNSASLHGFAHNPYAWMRHCAVFVLSSRHEGLPGALIEAMACGSPVVATDCPHGPAEILAQGQWGRLVPVDNAPALADAMVATLQSAQKPDVAMRANTFNLANAVGAYKAVLLPPKAKNRPKAVCGKQSGSDPIKN